MNKIDVAKEHILSAIKLFELNLYSVSAYLLAAAASDIILDLAKIHKPSIDLPLSYENISSVVIQTKNHDLNGKTIREVRKDLVSITNFLKHADQDPYSKLNIENFDSHNTRQIFFAALNFIRYCEETNYPFESIPNEICDFVSHHVSSGFTSTTAPTVPVSTPPPLD